MTRPDLATLTRIREKFLTPHPAGLADYWDSEGTLDAYDRTFARRIAWKWDAVLGALAEAPGAKRPQAPFGRVVDWGCGSGAASVAFARAAPDGFIAPGTIFHAHDRSPRAMEFCAARLREILHPDRVRTATDPHGLVDTDTLLLVSHVLTELPEAVRDDLVSLAARAGAVVWVEPGTPFCASGLVGIRETLRACDFTAVAPCPHASACGMVREAPDKNWCHFFADPPPEVFRDGEWVKLAKELGIDLRSLPLSYLVLVRETTRAPDGASALVIGRPRNLKGHSLLALCEPDGINTRDFQHRSDKVLARSLERAEFHRYLPRS